MGVLVINHITLDGVLQGPGRPDEDTRDGFRQGGWAEQAANDPAIGVTLGQRMGEQFSWLFGRRSYEDMLSHWNDVGGPFKEGLNQTMKYVASSDPHAHLLGRTPPCSAATSPPRWRHSEDRPAATSSSWAAVNSSAHCSRTG